MPTYVGLLRAINVGGRRKLPMATLRALMDDLGHSEVTTYIQSGNVVFAAAVDDIAELEASIEAAIAEEVGFEVPVTIRTHDELAAAVAANPYLEGDVDPARVGIAFLKDPPAPDRATGIERQDHGPDELVVAGREVHLHCPNGFGQTTLTTTYLERELGVVATVRNAKTVAKLLELSAPTAA